MSIAPRFTVKLVGVSFVDGYPDIVHRLHAKLMLLGAEYGELPLSLVREPDNPVHANAVAVVRDDLGPIGHLPRWLGDKIAPSLDAGDEWDAVLTEVNVRADAMDRPGITVRCSRA